jgi:Tol biopolymer transport system component
MTTPTRTVLCAAIALSMWLPQDISGPTRDVDVTVTEGTGITAAMSPDGRWIAIDLLGSLWLVPHSGGGDAKKITPDFLESRHPTWSPDSRALAFAGYGDDGAWHIYTIFADGSALAQLTSGASDDRQPAWSSDGTRILFSSDRGGGASRIWEVMPASRTLRQITARAGVAPCWAPNDRGLAFLSLTQKREESGIWTIDANGQEQLAVLEPQHGSLGPPAWNGRRFAFRISDESGVHLLADRIVTMNEDVFPTKPQWLSGSNVLYTADGHIKTRTQNNLVNVIPFRARVSLKRATYTAVHRVLEPSEPQRLVGIVNPAVSPDGKRVAFTALGDLWVLPVGEFPVRLTDDQAVDLDPSWSPDGTRIAFASDRGGSTGLWVYDFRAGIAALMTKGIGRVSRTAWSHDGRFIAYSVNRAEIFLFDSKANVDIGGWAAPTGNAGPREPMPMFGQLGRATWGSDSQTIAFDAEHNDPNHVLLYKFDEHLTTGALVQPDLSIRRNIDSPAWSPDGVKMAFVADGKLWMVPVNPVTAMATASPVSIAEDFPESPSWEGDSRHLVYLTPSGLRRVSAGGGLSEPVAAGLGWAPNRPPRRVIVHAGQIFDGKNDTLGGETDIVIENGIIADVTPHNDELHTGPVVDAAGETVMPGFIDTRTNLDPTYGEVLGRIWLAYGITSVRDVSLGSYAGVEQREAIANGRRIGPRVFIAGDPFDGRQFGHNTSMTSEQQLEPALARATLLDVDVLAMRGRLGGLLERRLADYAHARGLRTTTESLFAAMTFGFDELDEPIGRTYRDIIDVIGKSEMLVAPMVSESGGFQASYEKDPTLLRDPRLALFPQPLAERYERMSTRPQLMADRQRLHVLENSLKPRREALRALAAAGARIVVGTNAPAADLPYGLSLHIELEQLVLAGIPPFRALQAATLTAAEALGVSDELGTIEQGKLADLVFLGGDPLQDIRRTRDVRRVMRGGRLYTADVLMSRH